MTHGGGGFSRRPAEKNNNNNNNNNDSLEAVVKQLGEGIESLLSMVDRGLCGEPLETPRPHGKASSSLKVARSHHRSNSHTATHNRVESHTTHHHYNHGPSVWNRLHTNGSAKSTAPRNAELKKQTIGTGRSGSPQGLRSEKKKSASPLPGRYSRLQRSASAEPSKPVRVFSKSNGKRTPSVSVARTTGSAMSSTVVSKSSVLKLETVPVVSPTISPATAPAMPPHLSEPIRAQRPASVSPVVHRKPAPCPIVGDPSTRYPDIHEIIKTQKKKADSLSAKIKETDGPARKVVEPVVINAPVDAVAVVEPAVPAPQQPVKKVSMPIPKLSLGSVIEKKQTDPSFTYEKFLTITTGEEDIRAMHEVVIEKKQPEPVESKKDLPPPSYEATQAPKKAVPKVAIPSLALKPVLEQKKNDPTFTYEKFLTLTTGETDLRAEA